MQKLDRGAENEMGWIMEFSFSSKALEPERWKETSYTKSRGKHSGGTGNKMYQDHWLKRVQ